MERSRLQKRFVVGGWWLVVGGWWCCPCQAEDGGEKGSGAGEGRGQPR